MSHSKPRTESHGELSLGENKLETVIRDATEEGLCRGSMVVLRPLLTEALHEGNPCTVEDTGEIKHAAHSNSA